MKKEQESTTTTMVTITMTEEQARIVMNCLELYVRLRLGQFDVIKNIYPYSRKIDYHEYENVERIMKRIIFPELEFNASYGIYNTKESGRDAQIAWDMIQSIRHPLSWHLHPEGGITKNFDKPMATCDDCKMPNVKITEEKP